MSVKKLNFHHMSHLRFPSLASKSTKDWTGYFDRVDIPSLVLMENMEREGAENIFVAFKDLNDIFSDNSSAVAMVNRKSGERRSALLINSKIALVSMRTEHRPMLPEPIRISFEHVHRENASESPKCVHWDSSRHDWSDAKCRLDWTNATHSECHCFTFGLLALLEEIDADALEAGSSPGVHVTIVVGIIVATIVVFCLAVGFGVGFDYCRRVREQSRYKWGCGNGFSIGGRHAGAACRRRLPCFQNKSSSSAAEAATANNRNIYVTQQQRGANRYSVHGGNLPTTGADHYMEVT